MKRIYLGAAYYPELWPKEEIDRDIRHMKKTGICCVRMGEFSWAFMEPDMDHIDLSFFIRLIPRLKQRGIDTVFCTPTPTPPIWMSHGHPERLHVNEKGELMNHGARQHCCINHPFYRERVRIIVEALARALGPLSGVIAWQIDNELKSSLSECMCATCDSLWKQWLEKRYGRISALNEAWGTEIWSQKYQDFDQVPQPLPAPLPHNASLSSAYREFSREKVAEFIGEQAAILRKYTRQPVTHNTNRLFHVDNALNMRHLDFASFDAYPDADSYRQMLQDYDLWRNAASRKPFWVMETSPYSAGNLRGHTRVHPAGFVRAEAVAACALGAEGFSFWLWRQQRTGFEIPHGAILSSWGEPTIGYEEVKNTRNALRALTPILNRTSPPRAEVAVTYSDHARSFFMTEPMEKLDYISLISAWYERILDLGLYRDLLFETADLHGCKLLMTPFVPYLSPDFLSKVDAFIRHGGIWIAGPLTGGRTSEHTAHTDACLGTLEKMAGIKTVHAYPMTGAGIRGTAFGMEAPLGYNGYEWIPVRKDVVTHGHYIHSDQYAFMTERRLGRGRIVMLGAMPQGPEGDRLLRRLIMHYADEAGVSLRTESTPGTLVAPRIGRKNGMILVIVNMDGRGGTAVIPGAGYDLLGKTDVPAGPLDIGHYAYRVIRLAESGIQTGN